MISTALVNPFVVEVRDENGDLSPGVTVTFDVIAGGGSLSTTSTMTDTNGHAQSTLTLGSAPGTNTVSVSAEEISQPVTFTAQANADNGDGNGNGGGNNGGGNNGGGNNGGGTVQDNEPVRDVRRFVFQLSLDAGWNFVHIPLEVTQVDGESMSFETVGNLFQVLMPDQMYIYDRIHFHDGSHWLEVFGDSEEALGPNQGVAVYMDAPMTVNLVGSPLPTSFAIQRGFNFVGIPRQSSNLRKVSDFLTFYPNVCAVLVATEGELYLVGRAGDSGDVEITGGQAFGIVSIDQYMTNFSGAAWGKVFAE